MSEIKLTICICTHNRLPLLLQAAGSVRQSLEHTPESLRAQTEFIVVANACSDETNSSSQLIFRGMPCLTALYPEPRVGLSVARNRGIREARGTYIAFIDDDARLEPAWISSFFSAVESYPQATALGGPVLAAVPELLDLPKDIVNEYVRFKTYPQGPYPDPLKDYPVGCNCVIRVEKAKAVGGYAEDMGRKGNQPFDFDEKDFYLRLVRAGYDQFIYVTGLAVKHGPVSDDLSFRKLLRGYFFTGRSLFHLLARQGLSHRAKLAAKPLGLFRLRWGRGWLKDFFGANTFPATTPGINDDYAVLKFFLIGLGMRYERFKQRFKSHPNHQPFSQSTHSRERR